MVLSAMLCAPTTAFANIGGTVFRDYNANGAQDALEGGVAAITVRATDASGAVVASTTSAADGVYALAGLTAGENYRVEFGGEPTFLKQGANGLGAGSSIRFVSDGATVNHGLNNPADYCQANPQLALPCHRFGSSTGTFSGDPAVRTVASNAQGRAGTFLTSAAATQAQVGTTWGTAYQRETKSIFVAAFQKRHAGFGPGGPGQIYRISAAGAVTPFVNIGTLFPGSIGADSHPATVNTTPAGGAWFWDAQSYDKVGKESLGDLDISDDGKTLYAINLHDRKLYMLPIGLSPTAPNAAQTTAIDTPRPAGCPDADVRPFALAYNDGALYVGEVCSGQTSGLLSDVRAYVYRLDGPGFTKILDESLEFPRGHESAWYAWNDTFLAGALPTPWLPDSLSPWAHGQPLLTDVVFDQGDIILGFRDRHGDQVGNGAGDLSGASATQYAAVASGDIMRSCLTSAGTYLLERNAASQAACTTSFGPSAGASPATPEGPGGGEFYFGDEIACCHSDVAQGGLVQIPGRSEVISTFVDPYWVDGSGTFANGIRHLNNSTGAHSTSTETEAPSFNAVAGAPDKGFGKANGLGDLEALCDMAPIEIGNRVWKDTVGDGIQDAGEPAIANVTVHLYNGANTLIGTTTTNSNGEYLFSSSTIGGYGADGLPNTADDTPGLKPSTTIANTYSVRLDSAADYAPGGPLNGYAVTAANAGSNAALDSDAVSAGATDARIAVATGAAGDNDHTRDFGFVPGYSLGNHVWFDSDNNGRIDATEAGVARVLVNVYVDANADGAPDGPAIGSVRTDANGYYLFNLDPGTYVVGIDQSNFTANGELVGTHSSTPDETNPNADGDNNDNGPGAASAAVLSGPVTLGPGDSEPTGETGPTTGGKPDARSNLTVDFGFAGATFSLGNKVWLDSNNNGLIDASETGIGGVSLSLFRDADGNGVPDGGAIATTTTTATGEYLFDGLASGKYLVAIDGGNFPAGGPLEQYRSSTPDELSPDADTDNTDNGIGAGQGPVYSGTITLGPSNSEPLGEPGNRGAAPDSRSNLTVDFGFVAIGAQPLRGTASLGDRVWYDNDRDGKQDKSEKGVAGVTVKLYDANGKEIARTVTDANGSYRFTDLPAGTYCVGFDGTTLPKNYTFTKRDAKGSTRGNGSDADANGRTVKITLKEGQYDPDWDAGIVRKSRASATVLKFTKSASSTDVKSGQVVTFTLRVKNNGASTATDVEVCDPLPGVMTLAAEPKRATIANGRVCFKLGDLKQGEVRIVSFTVKLDQDASTGPVKNRATVTSSNTDSKTASAVVQVTHADAGGIRGDTGVTG